MTNGTFVFSNAIKFTDKGEVNLIITLLNETKKDSLIKFEVQDTGIGIHQENISKVFEEFYQETLPNALAEMWLWLKEHNYLP